MDLSLHSTRKGVDLGLGFWFKVQLSDEIHGICPGLGHGEAFEHGEKHQMLCHTQVIEEHVVLGAETKTLTDLTHVRKDAESWNIGSSAAFAINLQCD